MSDISNPHDKFFKESFSRRETASDFLRHYLPGKIAEALDLSSLEPLKDSFIDKKLQAHYSDLLYSVKLRDGQDIYVYVLFEHKSNPEPMVALQLLRYMVRIWDIALQRRQQLSPILPIVVYHGQKTWRISPYFRDLFAAPEVLIEFLPDFRYHLADLSRYPDGELKGQILLRVALLVMKHISSEDLPHRLIEIFALLRDLLQQERGVDYVETILRYLTAGSDKIDQKDLNKAIETTFPEGGDLMPTIAQKWIEQGKKQGLEKGRQEGMQKGMRQGLLDAIELGLELKFGPDGLRLLPEIRKIKDIDTLHSIRKGIKTCQTVEELRRIYNST